MRLTCVIKAYLILSYLIVEIDGRRQHAYSNKLRRYDVRVDEVICNTLVMSDMAIESCSIVYDKDKNF